MTPLQKLEKILTILGIDKDNPLHSELIGGIIQKATAETINENPELKEVKEGTLEDRYHDSFNMFTQRIIDDYISEVLKTLDKKQELKVLEIWNSK